MAVAPLKIYNLPEFNNLELPAKSYLVDPIIPCRGLVEIYSKTGVGKTTFALTLGIAVALGKPFLKWSVPSKKRVLYIDGEMSPQDMQERAQAAAQFFGVDVSDVVDFRIINRDVNNGVLPDIGEVAGQNEFDAATKDADLIILDNLSTLRFTGRENEADSWSTVQRWLLNMRGQGKTVIILHHAGKDGTSRGTSRRHDALDTVIKLKRPPDYLQSEGAVFEVHFEKSRSFFGDAAEPFGLSHAIVDGVSIWDKFLISDENLQEAIRLVQQGLKQTEIAERLGVSQSKVSKLLKSAKEDGLL
ncbi:MAG: AAA family ATPase [Candidatus Puniceispirillaceae bacterium]